MDIPSSEICVGDILILDKNDRIPADCVLLKATDPNVFIRTDQLDGETDWKLRIPAMQHLKDFESIFNTKADLIGEAPNVEIYKFVGKINEECLNNPENDYNLSDNQRGTEKEDLIDLTARNKEENTTVKEYKLEIDGSEEKPSNNSSTILKENYSPTAQPKKKTIPLSLENMLWMNTVLASGTAMCCVIYTGKDTRAVLNTLRPKNKFGLIDQELNRYSKLLFTLCLFFAIVFSFMRGLSQRMDITLIRFIVIFSNVIPISLKVSIDWARYVYTQFIEKDIRCTVRNSNIPEELGRISYLLSDKTGTLTCNEMEMRKVHIGTICFTQEINHEVTELLHQKLCNESKCVYKDDKKKSTYREQNSEHNREDGDIHYNQDTAEINNNQNLDDMHLTCSRTKDQDEKEGRMHKKDDTGIKDSKTNITADNTDKLHEQEDVNGTCSGTNNHINTTRNLENEKDKKDIIHTDENNGNKNCKFGNRMKQGDDHDSTIHADEDNANKNKKPGNRMKETDDFSSIIHKESNTDSEYKETSFSSALDGSNTGSQASPVSPSGRQSNKRKKIDLPNRVYDLLVGLSVCHNVTPVIDEGVTTYQASSPDEVAIVQWTEKIGLKLVERTPNMIVLRDFRGKSVYKVLHIFPFTSESKRMGIVLQDEEGNIDFYIKGADVVMSKIVKANDWLAEETDNMAREGLRTLVIGKKNLTAEEYAIFSNKYTAAITSMDNRNELTARAVALLEKDVTILGLTGVEDRLQDEVKESLENLRNAGIKIWMLTGDKVETATCIAISSKLFSKSGTYQKIENVEDSTTALEILKELKANIANNTNRNYLIIDGGSLRVFMEHFKMDFISAVSNLEAVVCCRCSPTQKADVARELKRVSRKRVACIGDGGNDVSMITEADVGIGIIGKEGKQASLAADYSLDNFKDVCVLFLWHGRNCYKGTARLSHLIIHRGTIVSVIQAIFCSIFDFSPISLYQGAIIVGYVTLYTSLPLFCSILSRDADKEMVFRYPELYKDMNYRKALSFKTFASWNVISFYQGAIIMLLSFLLFPTEFYSIITITFSSLIINELLMVSLSVSSPTRWMVFGLFISLLFYVASFFFLKDELVLPCPKTEFLWKLLLINLAAILFSVIQKLWNRFIAPSSTLKLAVK